MIEKRPPSGFEELEHTADWAMRVWAPDPATLFAACARGMYALAGIEVEDRDRVQRRIALEAPDRETLLVDFLSELLFLAEEDGLAFDQLEIELNGRQLSAQLGGGPVAAIRKEIKAVTYHGMSIKQADREYSVEVVFDV
jgi:SHS2 domain-containing protein